MEKLKVPCWMAAVRLPLQSSVYCCCCSCWWCQAQLDCLLNDAAVEPCTQLCGLLVWGAGPADGRSWRMYRKQSKVVGSSHSITGWFTCDDNGSVVDTLSLVQWTSVDTSAAVCGVLLWPVTVRRITARLLPLTCGTSRLLTSHQRNLQSCTTSRSRQSNCQWCTNKLLKSHQSNRQSCSTSTSRYHRKN